MAEGIAFLPPGSSALGCCKFSSMILEGLSARVGDCVLWGEESVDVVRIAMGGIRERIVKAVLVSWREGTMTLCPPIIASQITLCPYS